MTHAHGQGYADINPIVPELVESMDYWKGPFYAHLGDLSTAGAARFNYFDILPQGTATIGIGQDNYFHALLADTIEIGQPAGRTATAAPLPTLRNTTTTTGRGCARGTRTASTAS